MSANGIILELLRKGVEMPAPQTVFIGPDVTPENIAAGAIIHPGCRIRGAAVSIGPGCAIGAEGPAVVENCQLGADVSLGGGFFSNATFLDGASFGSSAHVRPGCLIEEEANAAHAVGIKQTILFPFVTLGSLINFCDCLMAGGSGKNDHGEVGSSYVHFNFTPRGDKATPSIFGDVPRGVMLDRPPVFLGGQGGAVGPRRVEFGTLVPAGTILRHDIPDSRAGAGPASTPAPAAGYKPGPPRKLETIVRNNLFFLGNIRALQEWHKHARRPFMQRDRHSTACHAGALRRLGEAVEERLRRMSEFAEKTGEAAERAKSDDPVAARFIKLWPAMMERLADEHAFAGDERQRDSFLAALPGAGSYLDAIRSLPVDVRGAGTAWLQTVVDAAAGLWPD